MAAPSVAVKIPAMMPPMTTTIRVREGMARRAALPRFFQSYFPAAPLYPFLPAAATAAQMGVKAITIEKSPTIGGQLHVIEGTYAVGTDIQRKEMIGLNAEKSFDQTMKYAAWRADPQLEAHH